MEKNKTKTRSESKAAPAKTGAASKERTVHQLDATDRQILDRLKTEPRVTNKALAEELSLSEVTIASRIRAMESGKIMRVMAQRDFRTIGGEILTLVDIDVLGRTVDAVAHDLTLIENVGSVSILMGEPSIIVEIHTPDLAALEDVLLNQIAKVKGVSGTSANMILKVIKYRSEMGNLHL
ncbi:MAG: AsnC family transcriptional regulator [Hydrocarboniphaga sp.]|uniref:Lrp/AsnC family transcriptional regulator n=1 Tax=Hydrocarboniphaga sp. TaxID=2033016 RepID=UPI002619E587|nr:Lrp/AsnC family transcriptional regulator [Hydrocarboniphaga sp.]MDB5969973.1 AsnC family transcriptional regulator [Hydrocarboniphaga sp.]